MWICYVSKTDALIKREFSKEASEYRICIDGDNIEDIYINLEYKVYNHNIIIRLRYGI